MSDKFHVLDGEIDLERDDVRDSRGQITGEVRGQFWLTQPRCLCLGDIELSSPSSDR